MDGDIIPTDDTKALRDYRYHLTEARKAAARLTNPVDRLRFTSLIGDAYLIVTLDDQFKDVLPGTDLHPVYGPRALRSVE